MASTLSNLNGSLSNALRVFDGPVASNALRLFLILYGGLAAPSLPTSISQYFSNTWVRLAVCGLVLWAARKDVGLAILVSAVYLGTLSMSTKNAVYEVAQTGQVSDAVKVIVTGNSGPSIKPTDVVQAENKLMDESVSMGQFHPALVNSESTVVSKPVIPESHYAVPPEATFSAKGTPSAGGYVPLPTVPAKGSENVSGAALTQPETPAVPKAYATDKQLSMASV